MTHIPPHEPTPPIAFGPSAEEIETINRRLGDRLQTLRTLKGWSREALGERIGVTGQQIRKYETAENRLSADRLALCAKALKVSAATFYDDYGHARETSTVALTIAKEMDAIADRNVRKALYELSKAINEAG